MEEENKHQIASDTRVATAATVAVLGSQVGCWVPKVGTDILLEKGFNKLGYTVREEGFEGQYLPGYTDVSTHKYLTRKGDSWNSHHGFAETVYAGGSAGIWLGSAILGILAMRTCYRAVMGNRVAFPSDEEKDV